jgi:hypothetical protein
VSGLRGSDGAPHSEARGQRRSSVLRLHPLSRVSEDRGSLSHRRAQLGVMCWSQMGGKWVRCRCVVSPLQGSTGGLLGAPGLHPGLVCDAPSALGRWPPKRRLVLAGTPFDLAQGLEQGATGTASKRRAVQGHYRGGPAVATTVGR